MQLELPKQMKGFGDRLRDHIAKYRRIGQNLSAEVDEQFYFRTGKCKEKEENLPSKRVC